LSSPGRGIDNPEQFVVRQHFNVEGGQQAATTLLAQGATGIVASSDEMAFGAYRAAERTGLSVPKDVSVVGYDDSSVLDFIGPPLTTVRQPIERIAENVARIVTSLVSNRTVSTEEILVEPELRLRGSTAPAPIGS
jgi:DNA-binding LacI/PurR family transcriptional regulator